MNILTQLKKKNLSILMLFIMSCFVLCVKVQAVVPAPDGGYPGFNTAEGQAALLALSSGTYNTGVGYFALLNNTSANFNTALGALTLASNTTGQENTATGAGALLSNMTAGFNTANGALALLSNTTGIKNVAVGSNALTANVGASFNTAIGSDALITNTSGQQNTAVGAAALSNNTDGIDNVGVGVGTLHNNTTGTNNIGVGLSAGFNQTTGSNNIYIGGGPNGVAGESNTCYIASIFNQPSPNGVPVVINSNNKLGTATSSKRFKDEIKPMGDASEALFALKPVTFHYKREFDPAATPQFGLVAEDVEKTSTDLVVHDRDGKPYSVRYDAVNAMLLNEFLKQHGKVEKQEATITRLEKQIAVLTAGLQKVNAQLEVSKRASELAGNNQ